LTNRLRRLAEFFAKSSKLRRFVLGYTRCVPFAFSTSFSTQKEYLEYGLYRNTIRTSLRECARDTLENLELSLVIDTLHFESLMHPVYLVLSAILHTFSKPPSYSVDQLGLDGGFLDDPHCAAPQKGE
jgi:hypothetical protein